MKFMLLPLAVLATSAFVPSAASASVSIDFEGSADNFNVLQSHNGFDFAFTARGWGVIGPAFPFEPAFVSNGTTRLIASGERDGPGRVVITQTGGGLFSMTTFDAGSGFIGTSGSITVTGTYADLSTVSLDFAVVDSFQTYLLPGTYSNLASITFAETGLFGFRGQGFALDNLTDGAVVPEPASWALMIAGFGLVGMAARRREGRLALQR